MRGLILFGLTICSLRAGAGEIVLDNAYVRVSRDEITCPTGAPPQCGDRVIVAISDTSVSSGGETKSLGRGDAVVLPAGETLQSPAQSGYFEVVIKPQHPPAGKPAVTVAPEKNALLYDGTCYFVFEERLQPGDTRARHSHSHRVVIQLNRTKLQQWPDGSPEVIVEAVPDKPGFSPPVVHVVKNIGEVPLRGVIIEFRPDCTERI